MTTKELREKTIEELKDLEKKTREELEKLVTNLYKGKEKNYKKPSSQKKLIARIKTIIREKEVVK